MSERARPYPLFLLLEDRPVLVVGAGGVGARKVAALLESGAAVTVVAPEVGDEVRALAEAGRVALRERRFADRDAEGMAVVIAATSSREANEAVAGAARRRGIPINVVDVPDLCDFHVPAVVRRGPIAVALSSSGAAPGLTRRLARELQAELESSLGDYAELVEAARLRIRAIFPDDSEQRRRALESVLDSEARELLASGRPDEARAAIERVLEELAR